VPVPHRSKNPNRRGWQALRLDADDLPANFNGRAMNVGALLGEPSGWMVDVDLDCPEAVALADDFLPPTGMTWGRASKPRSHRIYRLTTPALGVRWRDAKKKMLVELRSHAPKKGTPEQTIAPGSIHPSGEAVRWYDDGEPAMVEPAALIDAIARMVCKVKAVRAEVPRTSNPTPANPATPDNPDTPANPAIPVHPLPIAEVLERSRVDEPGQHDEQTRTLARGLKLNAGLTLDAAEGAFLAWWRDAAPHCSEPDPDAAMAKFLRAWEWAEVPLDAPGLAAGVLARLDELPETPEEALFNGDRARRIVRALAAMGRASGGRPFALSCWMLADAFGCSPTTAHNLIDLAERRSIIETTSRGRAGANGQGKARRLRWKGLPNA
jgi:hypothetical protein